VTSLKRLTSFPTSPKASSPNTRVAKCVGTTEKEDIVVGMHCAHTLLISGLQKLIYCTPSQMVKKDKVQVGSEECEHDLSVLCKGITTFFAGKCVNPAMQGPYSVSVIEKAMSDAGCSVAQRSRATPSSARACIASIISGRSQNSQ
jgi:hypothetical protein